MPDVRSEPTSGPADRWTVEYGGRRIELDADEEAWRLWVDQKQVAILEGRSSARRFGDSDVLVEVDTKYGGAIKRAALVVGDDRKPLDPPHRTELGGDEEVRQASEVPKRVGEGDPDPSTRRRSGGPVDIWSGRSGGHHIEVDGDGESDARLWVDGKVVAVVEEAFGKIQFGGAGVLVDVRIKLSGAIKRAMLVSPGERFELDPPRNTKEGRRELARRARRESWRRSRLYTSGRAALERLRGSRDSPWRHATRGVARVVIPLIVVTGLFSFFPHIDIPFPSINLDLPTIPSPELPTINLPGWLQWILERSHYIVPILIGLGLSLLEIRRRRAGHADPRTPASKVERLARRYFGPGRD